MRVLFVIVVTWICAASCDNVRIFRRITPVLNYHEEFGIPQAKKIREAEELMLAGRSTLTRIVGGDHTSIKTHPYLVGLVISLLGTADQSVCGGSLLNQRKVVTAAHCWDDGRSRAWLFMAVLGSEFVFHGGSRIPSTIVVTHPGYVADTYENDVAVLELCMDVEFSAKIQPIALPSVDQLTKSFVGFWATASGYGRVEDGIQVGVYSQVNQVSLNIIPQVSCAVSFGQEFVHASNLCTSGLGGVGICLGDSGGPLVFTDDGQDVLIGISSFVAKEGCSLGYPSAFARVTAVHDFITSHL